MAQDIIQHHQPFDFDKFFKDETSKYINIDYNDYQTFFKGEGEVHSLSVSLIPIIESKMLSPTLLLQTMPVGSSAWLKQP